jgi:DNA polymerase-3 subunit gamma/tau
MAYQVLARKYRPQRFADVAGQDHVTVTLMNALTQQRIAHGYIFSGHRGIGKTTIARILACALNCRNAIGSELRPTAEPCLICESCTEIRAGNATDVIEIDAATNRGIDEIRELRDAARYRPSRDKYKIYILDEAHQITDAAFNALLKTLEEPPDHIVFMMATTQPEDIPQTVRSRCQVFNFHAVKLADILAELRGIALHEGVHADEPALNLLAEAGDGSMRDALSVMDQAIASAPVEDGHPRLDDSQIRELMGSVPNATFERILIAVDENRSAEVMTVANELMDSGNSPAQLARQCVRYLRSCVIAKIAHLNPDPENFQGTELLQISPEEQRRAARSAALFSEEELTRFLQTMLRTFDELGYRQEQRFHFELGLLKLVHLRRLLPVEAVLSALPTPSATRAQASVAAPKPTANLTAPVLRAAAAKPAFSPFDADRSRRYETVSPGHTPAPQPASVPMPPPVFEPVADALLDAETATTDAAHLQTKAVEALAAAPSQTSAADLLHESLWTIAGNTLTIQTSASATMLPMIVNPQAEKLLKQALREAGAGTLKLLLLPGAPSIEPAKKPRVARAGSADSKAREHPMILEAQRLFDAEIRSVQDLSEIETA